ncbi:MAG: M28 family peptidase [Pseudonocardiales bacterium]
MGSRTAAAWGAVLVVVVVAVLTLLSDRPPSPVPASAPGRDFSAERALAPLREFATEPRPLGSAASDRARDYLAGALRSAGFSVEITRGVGAFTVEGVASFGRVDNIVAALPGRDPTGSVVLAAHYDSVATGPGASDDGAAIAAMLAPAAITLVGTGPGRWPTEVRFGDLPPEGIDLTLRTTHQGPLRISAYDQTRGLVDVPGFQPRPPDLESRHSYSDTVVVARTYKF